MTNFAILAGEGSGSRGKASSKSERGIFASEWLGTTKPPSIRYVNHWPAPVRKNSPACSQTFSQTASNAGGPDDMAAMLADPRGARLLAACLAALLLPAGCSPEPSAEEQLRAWVSEAALAASEKDIGHLKGLVSDRYADARGNDGDEIRRYIALQLLRRGSVRALARVRSLEILEADAARLEVTAALARVALPGPEAPARLNADVYRIDLELVREPDGWRAVAARWRPAPLDELL